MEWNTLHVDQYDSVTCIKLSINRFFPFMHVYMYVIDGLVIDTGPKHSKVWISQVLKTRKVNKVAITHEHKDHCGTAKWIARTYSVPIYMNKVYSKRWSLGDALFIGQIRKHAEQFPKQIECDQHTFIPVFTPGHTRDHTCLYEPNKGWLFTGDLYITPEPKVSLWSESLSKYIQSLKTVLTLEFDTIFCAHQGIVENGRQKLEEKLEYLESIQSQAVELYEQGYRPRAIAKKLFPKKARLERLTFGAFSSLHLVRQLIRAHNKHM